MSARRAPSAPPDLPGFEHRRLLGSGGFADVFLYQQHMPKREVAVKVLLKDRMASGAVENFAAEANLMAQLSTHPAIVSIYEAGMSADNRPYLVMENCPKPNLQARYRKEPLGIAETLRIGVQVAGAVETAHRAGILHRDIKPANILVTAYNRPALTDFGIAGEVDAEGESVGMSIPWSPPESFEDPPRSSTRTDVYALAATIYTLLAGHTPFEVPGEPSTAMLLMDRIESTPVPPLRRADAPPALNAVLAKAMAKRPEDRYASVLELAHALQRLQAEMSMSVTPVDVLDDAIEEDIEDDEDDGRTRVRAVQSIDPTSPPTAPTFTSALPADTHTTLAPRRASSWGAIAPPPAEAADEEGATVLRAPQRGGFTAGSVPEAAAVDSTVLRPASGPVEQEQEGEEDSPPRSRRPLIIAAALVVVVGGGIGAALALGGGDAGADASEPDGAGSEAPVQVVDLGSVAGIEDVSGVVDGTTATFTWTSDELGDGDTYQWRVVGSEDGYASTADAEASFDVEAEGSRCIEVRVLGGSGRIGDSAEGCA
ncbi:serine/threonine-protein kinase [Demequina sp. NBRC 110054]|uniref:serine/threonine-protein kinase n=1 Tax=Demequina sp. NBRC 110054 TaxID=1570343 RepID=UPI000A06ED69|nr:serine/threonine-protein kinase [Demequina sp. NBRC 110054]